MSMQMLEGWDMYGTASDVVVGNWTEVSGTPTIETTGGPLNEQHCSMNSTSDFVRKDVGNIFNPADQYIGLHFKVDSLTTNIVIQWTDQNNTDGRLADMQILSDGSIRFRQNVLGNPTLGTTAAGLIIAGVWYTLEVRLRPSSQTFSTANADGQIELRIDGTVRLNLSNLSIGPADSSSPRPTGIGKVEFKGGTGVHRFGDIYIFNDSGGLNNDFAGDFRIQTLRPNADTATASWTPVNAGDHFAEVDESAPDGDTTYVSSQESTARDIYELTDLTGDVGAVLGYGPIMIARKEIGSTQNVGFEMVGSTETVTFAGQSLSDDYEVRSTLRSASVDDPSQTTSPDIAEVNALKAGIYIP